MLPKPAPEGRTDTLQCLKLPKCWQSVSNTNIYYKMYVNCIFNNSRGPQKPSDRHICISKFLAGFIPTIYVFFLYIYIFLFDLKNTCQLNSYFGIGYLFRNVHFLTYTYICIEYMLPTFWGIDVSWSFSVRPSGAELGALHFVIYIFVLDIYGQHLGDICQLKVFCAPFGRRVGECTFCKVYFL